MFQKSHYYRTTVVKGNYELEKSKPLLMVLYRKYDSAYNYPKALYKADNLSATN